MTPQPPTHSRRAAGGEPEKTYSDQLKCKLRIQVSENIYHEYSFYNFQALQTWLNTHIHPAPVTPATDAPDHPHCRVCGQLSSAHGNAQPRTAAETMHDMPVINDPIIHQAMVDAGIYDGDEPDETAGDGDGMPKRVRIVKCSRFGWWYEDRIGETFVVLDERKHPPGEYQVIDDRNTNHNIFSYIHKSDTEPVPDDPAPESVPEPLQVLLNAVDALLMYREHNTLNWQLEKADDYFRDLRRAREAYPEQVDAESGRERRLLDAARMIQRQYGGEAIYFCNDALNAALAAYADGGAEYCDCWQGRGLDKNQDTYSACVHCHKVRE